MCNALFCLFKRYIQWAVIFIISHHIGTIFSLFLFCHVFEVICICIIFFQYPGVAQLVGRLIWVQDAGSSNLPTRTNEKH